MTTPMNFAESIRRADEAVGAALDRVFAPGANPWRHLGSLAFLLFVVCAASGIYLYAVFDTSVAGAYESGRDLDRGVVGSLLRGLHRYSADAFALFTLLHLAREAVRGRFRFHRAWSWLSGVVLLPLVWLAGITGFWLAWDERALFSALDAAEWLAAWPWGLTLFARNFVGGDALNDRFFSLVVFLHIGLPLVALAATWAHLQRLAQVKAWPPAALAVPVVATLAALAVVHPARSLGPTDAFAAPAAIAFDWFYFFPHALANAFTPAALWGGLAAGALLLGVLPWMPGRPRPAAARVDLARCNGCGRCAADCPFNAVEMVARSDARPHRFEARVDADLCAACGICAGACPSSTPFHRRNELSSGIDLPARTIAMLRAELDRALEAGKGGVVVFKCLPAGPSPRPSPKGEGGDSQPSPLGEGGSGAIAVECAAMVPPSFVQYALRRGAAGVVVAACREGDCEHRLGDRWTRERFEGSRAPALRATVPRERVRLLTSGSDSAAVALAVAQLSHSSEVSHV